jgi:hypothetical protein
MSCSYLLSRYLANTSDFLPTSVSHQVLLPFSLNTHCSVKLHAFHPRIIAKLAVSSHTSLLSTYISPSLPTDPPVLLPLRLSTLLSELLFQLTLSALCLTSDLTTSCHLAHPTYLSACPTLRSPYLPLSMSTYFSISYLPDPPHTYPHLPNSQSITTSNLS